MFVLFCLTFDPDVPSVLPRWGSDPELVFVSEALLSSCACARSVSSPKQTLNLASLPPACLTCDACVLVLPPLRMPALMCGRSFCLAHFLHFEEDAVPRTSPRCCLTRRRWGGVSPPRLPELCHSFRLPDLPSQATN